jgi:hydrophobic/amphiphilic exporter-1 (mainly G- bacteria), HAE1 family
MFKSFLHRPVLAIVMSLALVFLGLLASQTLPVSQFPEISPPRVQVAISYPGASADVLIRSTLIPLERSINGVQGMRYITSDATSAGEATIQVVFALDVDPNRAMVNVKNAVDQVMNLLPTLVQREGVVVSVIQPSMLMYINVFSTDPSADQKFVFNFANTSLVPELQRIKGIGKADPVGNRQFAMRVWLKPDRMRAYNISTEEVMQALADQSVIGRPGRTGISSGKHSQAIEYVLLYKGQLNKPEEYNEVILRSTPEGELLKLKDVAEVELGSEFFDIYSNLDGHPAAAIVLKQTFGSNAREVIADVKSKLDSMKQLFPAGMDYKISYDVSNFLDASIEKVLHTLLEAFILVSLVVFVFLGDWRSTLIPTLAVPVSLIGTFAVMKAFGLTINLVTLFALVLAIGIVVDNAIVVVEAVHTKMAQFHMSPYKAVEAVIGEISGAVIAITLMMTAVFIPVAFMSGPVGVFYRQFSITMATSIVISGIVALTLTPVLCAMILKPHAAETQKKSLGKRALNSFNRGFEWLTKIYENFLRRITHRRFLTVVMFAFFAFGVYYVSTILPAGFIPGEDQAMVYAIIQTPPGSTLEQTNDVVQKVQNLVKDIDGVESVSSLAGYEVLTEGRGSNAGTCLINLKHWSQRKESARQIMVELEEKTKNLGAIIEYFEPPAVPGYGAADGFSLRMIDKLNRMNYVEFDKVNQNFMDELAKRKELDGLFTFFAVNFPQYELVIDNGLAMQKGVSIRKALENLDILVGSTYEQGFVRFGQFFKLYVQSGPEYRKLPSDILQLYVKNDRDEQVPYSAFVTMKKTQGPNELTRYNLYLSSAIRGEAAHGHTSGEAIQIVKEVAAKTLPKGYDIAWEGLSYDEANRGNESVYIFGVVLLFVYLVLAAQYESFLIPLAVILSLPPGIFGSMLLLKLTGLSNDIYAQIGMLMLVGLLGKNAVLIVEFAAQQQAEGVSVAEAAIKAAVLRFRPILMTSFAFIMGLFPLAIATGPGAIGNRTIGTSALGGMLLGTVFGVILVPGLYFVFATMAGNRPLIRDEHNEPMTEALVHEKN